MGVMPGALSVAPVSERRLRSYDPEKYPCALCPIKTRFYNKEQACGTLSDPIIYLSSKNSVNQ